MAVFSTQAISASHAALDDAPIGQVLFDMEHLAMGGLYDGWVDISPVDVEAEIDMFLRKTTLDLSAKGEAGRGSNESVLQRIAAFFQSCCPLWAKEPCTTWRKEPRLDVTEGRKARDEAGPRGRQPQASSSFRLKSVPPPKENALGRIHLCLRQTPIDLGAESSVEAKSANKIEHEKSWRSSKSMLRSLSGSMSWSGVSAEADNEPDDLRYRDVAFSEVIAAIAFWRQDSEQETAMKNDHPSFPLDPDTGWRQVGEALVFCF